MEIKDLRLELENLKSMAQSGGQRLSHLRHRLIAVAKDLAAIQAELDEATQDRSDNPSRPDNAEVPRQG